MFERVYEQLLPPYKFLFRMVRSIVFALLITALALGVGVWGYHYYEQMSWVDAFVNAAMILSGMGPMGTLATSGGKVFAGFYALFSGLAFILIIGIVLAPIVHRFFHRFHLGEDDEK